MLERTANRILVVGGHPFRICFKHPNEQHRSHNTEDDQEQKEQKNSTVASLAATTMIKTIHNDNDIRNDNKEREQGQKDVTCGCCRPDSPVYSRCWPFLFLFSAVTDFPLPLPSDKKPGQHRDWGWVPVLVVLSIITFLYYGYLDQVCCKLYQNR